MSVTAAIASDNSKYSVIKVIPDAIYSSTVAEINLKISSIMKNEIGVNNKI